MRPLMPPSVLACLLTAACFGGAEAPPSPEPVADEAPTPDPPAETPAPAPSPPAAGAFAFPRDTLRFEYTSRQSSGWTQIVQVGPDWTVRVGRGVPGSMRWREAGSLDAVQRRVIADALTDPKLDTVPRRVGLAAEERIETTPQEHWLLRDDELERPFSRYGFHAPIHGQLVSLAQGVLTSAGADHPPVLSVVELSGRGWKALPCRLSSIVQLRGLATAVTTPAPTIAPPSDVQDADFVLHHVDKAGGESWRLLGETIVHIDRDGRIEAWRLGEGKRPMVDALLDRLDLQALPAMCP